MYKKIVGWSLIVCWLIWAVADTFIDNYRLAGWHALWITPILFLLMVAGVSFILWLID